MNYGIQYPGSLFLLREDHEWKSPGADCVCRITNAGASVITAVFTASEIRVIYSEPRVSSGIFFRVRDREKKVSYLSGRAARSRELRVFARPWMEYSFRCYPPLWMWVTGF